MANTKRAFSNSSKAWIQRHVKDVYVKQSSEQGLRSRSAFKLQEMQDRFKLIKPSDFVLDLGASPGGWSVIVGKHLDVSKGGMLISVDLLDMPKVGSFQFVRGDMTSDIVQQHIMELANRRKANVILSDMMCNTSGNKEADHNRSIELALSAFHFSLQHMARHGHFLCKYFRGSDEKELIGAVKEVFERVNVVKPRASRSESSEMYLLAQRMK